MIVFLCSEQRKMIVKEGNKMIESSNSIPKVIHYCWFGRNPLPPLACKCIESWRKYFPDYEIKEWSEDNYDVKKIPYIEEAYEAQKYAFVSDYARFDILYREGGVYFDTDVEVIRSFQDIIANGAFMGCERDGRDGRKGINSDSIPITHPENNKLQVNSDFGIAVAPGLGIAVVPGNSIYKEILDYYSTLHFKNPDGSNNLTTIVDYTMTILKRHGLQDVKGIQKVAGITIYPKEYFAPKSIDTKELTITKNTCSIHHYDASWAEWYDKAAGERGPKLKKYFGVVIGGKINVVIYILQKYGVVGAIKKFLRK